MAMLWCPFTIYVDVGCSWCIVWLYSIAISIYDNVPRRVVYGNVLFYAVSEGILFLFFGSTLTLLFLTQQKVNNISFFLSVFQVWGSPGCMLLWLLKELPTSLSFMSPSIMLASLLVVWLAGRSRVSCCTFLWISWEDLDLVCHCALDQCLN